MQGISIHARISLQWDKFPWALSTTVTPRRAIEKNANKKNSKNLKKCKKKNGALQISYTRYIKKYRARSVTATRMTVKNKKCRHTDIVFVVFGLVRPKT